MLKILDGGSRFKEMKLSRTEIEYLQALYDKELGLVEKIAFENQKVLESLFEKRIFLQEKDGSIKIHEMALEVFSSNGLIEVLPA
jgi:hypothetical protein